MEFKSYYLDDPIVGGRCFDVFEPAEITRDTAVFFTHGGGWAAGTRAIYHKIMQELNRQGYICASTDYRLAPAMRYASDTGVTAVEQLQDIREAYDAFVSILKSKGLPLKIAVWGSSAGAHLTALLALAEPGECGEKATLKNQWVKPVKAVLQATPVSFEPWEDIFPGIWASMQHSACGCKYEDNPEIFKRISPETYLDSDNPACFFVEAGNEYMFPPEINFEFVKKQQALGVKSFWKKYPMAEHGFVYDIVYPVQQKAFADIVRFLKDEQIPDAY